MSRLPMIPCPCDSTRDYALCCEPYLIGKDAPLTPGVLMRSRYTAYTLGQIDYIKKTMRAKALVDFNEEGARRWATRLTWVRLDVFECVMVDENKATVTFEAQFVDGARLKSIHEKSLFIREEGKWYYVDGEHLPPTQMEHAVSRSMSCPCGSARKFKNCHGQS